jgi:hypothetical protein
MRKACGVCIPKKAFIRIGTKNGATDHESNGGVMASIDVDLGEIGLGQTKSDPIPHLEVNPYSGAQFYGFIVPLWEEVKKLTVEAAAHIHGTDWIGWDVVIGADKPYLIEGNVGGGLTTSQRVLGGFIENGILEDWIDHFKIPANKENGISFEHWKQRFVKQSIKKLLRQ